MPVTSRKTTEVHAEYVNKHMPFGKCDTYHTGKRWYLHTPRTFIGYCSDWLQESCEVSGSRKQRSINALNMSFIPPNKRHFPPAWKTMILTHTRHAEVHRRGKITTNILYKQIFLAKSSIFLHFLCYFHQNETYQEIKFWFFSHENLRNSKKRSNFAADLWKDVYW